MLCQKFFIALRNRSQMNAHRRGKRVQQREKRLLRRLQSRKGLKIGLAQAHKREQKAIQVKILCVFVIYFTYYFILGCRVSRLQRTLCLYQKKKTTMEIIKCESGDYFVLCFFLLEKKRKMTKETNKNQS